MDKRLVEKILAARNSPLSEDVDVPEEWFNAGVSVFEDIPHITAGITTSEIVDLIRECRAGV